ncbi:lipocalin family protein [Thermomicrobium sp.]
MRRRAFLATLAFGLLTCRNANEQPAQEHTATPVASPRPASLFLTPPPAPGPVVFPRDFGSHDVLTEWWYYTGHLRSTVGERFGFQFVIFQVQRFGYPVVYAAHAALTLVDRQAFLWDERLIAVPQRQESWPLVLAVADWTIASDGETDRISARSRSFSFTLELQNQRPPLLHDEDGYFSWAPETGSYYYSRTRLATWGVVSVGGHDVTVSGLAWNDHQWGNFLLGAGGWDWFAIQLEDGTDLMLWQSRDAAQRVIQRSGTLLRADGSIRWLHDANIRLHATGSWQSPHSGAIYPSGWRIELPPGMTLTVTPLVLDQELQTLRSTGVIYWEGAVSVIAEQAGVNTAGQGYVELTGYATPSVSFPPP